MPVDTISGHQDDWVQLTIPLEGYPAFTGTRLRFSFYSDASVNYEGFYLDDVIVLDDVISSVEDEQITEYNRGRARPHLMITVQIAPLPEGLAGFRI